MFRRRTGRSRSHHPVTNKGQVWKICGGSFRGERGSGKVLRWRGDFVERALEAGKVIGEGRPGDIEEHFVVSLSSRDELFSVFREKNIELLETIAREEPKSIRELSRMVDRDVKVVHESLAEMEQLGIIKLIEEGRAKRPTVWYDEIDIEIDIPLDSGRDLAEAKA